MAALLRIFKHKWITPLKPVQQSYERQIIIVTGATSGIGVEAVYKFAALNAATVIIAARDVKRGETIKSMLEARLGRTDQLQVWELDMASYQSIMDFAQRASQLKRLDVAVLNAGVRRSRYTQLEYGWEHDLQINTLSTTLLAILLLPTLRQSKRITGRISFLEIVNSGSHQNAIVPPEVRLEDHVLEYYNKEAQFKEGKQYGISKVFLMYATQKLADETYSGDVIVTSVSPGIVLTDLGRDHFFPGVFVVAWLFIALFMRTPAQGANIILSGTRQGELVHGRFWQHDKVQPFAPSLQGADMKAFGVKIWNEIIVALTKDIPSMQSIVAAALELK